MDNVIIYSNFGQIRMSEVLDESVFVKKLLSGDASAQQVFTQIYLKRLYNFIFYRVNQDIHLTQDILQETCLGAIRTLDSWKGDSGFYTWLCSIAKHKIYDQVKNEPKKIDAKYINKVVEEDEITSLTLTELPPHYQQVLVDKYIHNYCVSEIASRMSTSDAAVQSLLARAREAFKEQYNHHIKKEGLQ